MARAAADDDANLAAGRRPPDHDPWLGERDNVGVGGGESFERLVDCVKRIVDQLLVDGRFRLVRKERK
jgi:hypothetical protein